MKTPRWKLPALFSVVALSLCVVWGLRAALQKSAAPHDAAQPIRQPLRPTQPMTQRLEQLARNADPEELYVLNRERAELRRIQLTALDPRNQGPLRLDLANELLRAGQTRQALQEFTALKQMEQRGQLRFSTDERDKMRLFEAIAYLRLGEQQNCLENHNAESCLAPIQGGGVHKDKSPSRKAIDALLKVLRRHPDDVSARWLLNIACMTVGDYPKQVPARWLIPPQAFAADYNIKRFTNVAGDLGLDSNGTGGGGVMEDFDNDGDLDIMCSSVGPREQLQLFRNNGDGTFTRRTKEAGLTGELGGLNLSHADYNNDGHADVLVLRGGWFSKAGSLPNSLLRNNGDGTFSDVTEQAGLLSFHPTQTAAWLDYNADGWLDVFIGNESQPGQPHPCELYRNNGDGTFTECAAENGLAIQAYVKAAVSSDYNNDGRPDLYLSCWGGKNILLRNDGPAQASDSALAPSSAAPSASAPSASAARWKWTDTSRAAGVSEPFWSFPAFFFDYDNDGWQDIFVSDFKNEQILPNIAADYLGRKSSGAVRARLYRNNRDGTFSDVSRAARLDKVMLAMGCNYGDLDNDGFLDFYLGTGNPYLETLVPNRMFRNAGGKFFQDVTTSGGFGHLQKGHGVSFGDIDNDGDQDIYEDMGGAYGGDTAFNTLYQNPGHGNRWLKLKLQGAQTNRAAIGARIKVTVRRATGRAVIHRAVSTGASFGSNPLRQEIGLGRATAIEAVEVLWPVTGKSQTLTGLKPDSFYTIREGEAQPQLVPVQSFSLSRNHAAGHHHHHHHH